MIETIKRPVRKLRRALFESSKDEEDRGSRVHEEIRRQYRTARSSNRRPKVFGIGLSKTGTTSLAQALEILGYRSATWALDGRILDMPEFYHLEAATDTPCAANFETLYYTFPGSKFIYTTRERDEWSESVSRHFETKFGVSQPTDFEEMWEGEEFWGWSRHNSMRFISIHESLYGGHENWSKAYSAFDKRVKWFFENKPEGRFLEMNITAGDGWEEICGFLNSSIPAEKFPHLNKTEK